MDERPSEATTRIARQVAVLGERVEVLLDLRAQRRRGVAVVVEVELELAVAAARERAERIEEVRPILFAGESWICCRVARLTTRVRTPTSGNAESGFMAASRVSSSFSRSMKTLFRN